MQSARKMVIGIAYPPKLKPKGGSTAANKEIRTGFDKKSLAFCQEFIRIPARPGR